MPSYTWTPLYQKKKKKKSIVYLEFESNCESRATSVHSNRTTVREVPLSFSFCHQIESGNSFGGKMDGVNPGEFNNICKVLKQCEKSRTYLTKSLINYIVLNIKQFRNYSTHSLPCKSHWTVLKRQLRWIKMACEKDHWWVLKILNYGYKAKTN